MFGYMHALLLYYVDVHVHVCAWLIVTQYMLCVYMCALLVLWCLMCVLTCMCMFGACDVIVFS